MEHVWQVLPFSHWPLGHWQAPPATTNGEKQSVHGAPGDEQCEQCGSVIPTDELSAVPETRYCPDCAAAAAAGPARSEARVRVHPLQ